MTKNKSVVGIYVTRKSAEIGIDSLREAGFPNTDISLLLPENLGSKEWFTLKTTKAPEGATTGAGSGAVIGGALVGSGIPEYEAKRYEERLQKGGILISVHCDTSQEIERARIVLQRTGAEDVSTTSESSAKGAGS